MYELYLKGTFKSLFQGAATAQQAEYTYALRVENPDLIPGTTWLPEY